MKCDCKYIFSRTQLNELMLDSNYIPEQVLTPVEEGYVFKLYTDCLKENDPLRYADSIILDKGKVRIRRKINREGLNN